MSLVDLPRVIGHRGAGGLAPGNTWEAFVLAVGHGVRAVELDVHVTVDGVAVVHHDARLSDGTELAHAERRRVPEAYPNLHELGPFLRWNGLRAVVEVKPETRSRLDMVLRGLQHVPWLAVASFDPELLGRLPGPRILNSMVPPDELPPGVAGVALPVDRAFEGVNRGYPTLAFVVDEPARARALLDGGVRAVYTGRPDVVREDPS